MQGPAGFGRYDEDPSYVGCPHARTDRSPCVARYGRLDLAGQKPGWRPAAWWQFWRNDVVPGVCRGCGLSPEELAEDLAREYEPAMALLAAGDPAVIADEFAVMIQRMTEPGQEKQ